MGTNGRRRSTRFAMLPSRTPAAVDVLSAELLRLSSDRNDSIATNAD